MAALFLVALSLRPQLVGLTPLIPDLERDLAMSHAVAGLLGTIPVLCMGIFAPVAPFVAARVGTTRALGAAIAMIGGFGILRSIAADAVGVITWTIGVGIGIGLSGALLPVVVKERAPDRPLAATASYSTGLQVGSAASAAIAVPVAIAIGSWRASLLAFSVLTLVLLIPWLAVLTRGDGRSARIRFERRDFLDRRGWLLGGAFGLYGIVYYGLISWLPDAYREVGWSPDAAGGLVALLNAAAIAGALSVGVLARRGFARAAALVVTSVTFVVATAGLAFAPAGAPAFALVAGYANGALFPLILALPLRLTATPARAAVVSSLMLGAGYTLAAVSPVALGALRDASGSFGASLAGLSIVGVALVVAMAIAVRQHGPSVEMATVDAGSPGA